MNVVAMPPPEARSDRLKVLMRAWHDAYGKVRDALRTIERPVPGQTHGPVRQLLMDAFLASSGVQDHLENRLSLLQRDVLDLLASDGLTEAQRGDAIAIVNRVRRNRVRDAKLLTPEDAALLESYHAMDAPGRQMLRTLITRLSTSNPKEVSR